MVAAYLRVSTEKQTLENQRNEIIRFAESRNMHIDKWVTEVVSGRKRGSDRKLGALVRTLTEIMTIVGELLRKKVRLYSTKDRYAFDDTINSKVLCFAFGLVAEIERNLISMRTREALALRRERGVVLGRRKGSLKKTQVLIDRKAEIVAKLNNGKSIAEICREYDVSRSTFDIFRRKYTYSVTHGDLRRWRLNGSALAEAKDK